MSASPGSAAQTLRELARLREAASKGPWWSDGGVVMPGEPVVGLGRLPAEIALTNPMRGTREEQKADADLIAAAGSTDFAALADEVERLEAVGFESDHFRSIWFENVRVFENEEGTGWRAVDDEGGFIGDGPNPQAALASMFALAASVPTEERE